jgi:hypothetical protein
MTEPPDNTPRMVVWKWYSLLCQIVVTHGTQRLVHQHFTWWASRGDPPGAPLVLYTAGPWVTNKQKMGKQPFKCWVSSGSVTCLTGTDHSWPMGPTH